MKKEVITIYVDNTADINEIRESFNKNNLSDQYKLNIIVGGDEEPTLSLGAFLTAKLSLQKYSENGTM